MQAARLPVLPDTRALAAPVAAQLAEADATARRNPTSGAASGDLGMVYHASLLDAQAHQAYAVAEELSQDLRWTYYRALLFEEHGEHPEALAAFTRVVTADASNGLAWFHIAEIAFKEGRLDAAADGYRRAREAPAAAPFSVDGVTRQSVPLAAYAEVGLARVALDRGDIAAARSQLESVVRAQPRFGPARLLLTQVQDSPPGRAQARSRASGRAYVPPADPLLDAVVARSRQSDLLLKHVALAARGGDRAWREFLIRRAVEFNPRAFDVLLEMSATLQSAGRHADALEYLRRSEQSRRTTITSWSNRGRACRSWAGSTRPKRFSAARAASATRLRSTTWGGPGQPGARRRSTRAVPRALAIDPFHVRAMNNLGVSLDRRGETGAALALYTRALKVAPDDRRCCPIWASR